MEQYIRENGITYERRGEQYYPLVDITEETHYPIGKYGGLHLAFLREHRRGTYTTLLTEYRLNEHLHEIDVRAKEEVRRLTSELARARGITEVLKESDPMEWVAQMNAARHDAEEIVLAEVIYQ